jgi:hypothetical protein
MDIFTRNNKFSNIRALNSMTVQGILLKYSTNVDFLFDLVFILNNPSMRDVLLFVDIHVRNNNRFIMGSPYLYTENSNRLLRLEIENINRHWVTPINILHQSIVPIHWKNLLRPLYQMKSIIDNSNILENKKMQVRGAVKLIYPRESHLIRQSLDKSRAGHMLKIFTIYSNIEEDERVLIPDEYVAGLMVEHSPWESEGTSSIALIEDRKQRSVKPIKGTIMASTTRSGRKKRIKKAKSKKRKRKSN